MIQNFGGIRSRMLDTDLFLRQGMSLLSSSRQGTFNFVFAEGLSQIKITFVEGKRKLLCFWGVFCLHTSAISIFTVCFLACFLHTKFCKIPKNILVTQPPSDHISKLGNLEFRVLLSRTRQQSHCYCVSNIKKRRR